MINLYDLDFVGFTFNGYHSYFDLNIVRVSQGNRYNEQLTPETIENVQDVPGDGQYYFDTYDKSKVFDIQIAYDHLTEEGLRKLRQVFNGKEIGELIFDERPYKVYNAKVTGSPTLKYVPFNDNNGSRFYRGEGSIQFTAYWPYAHTPSSTTKISTHFKKSGLFEMDGRDLSKYDTTIYPTKHQWSAASGLKDSSQDFTPGKGENFGDVPSPFIFKTTEDINPNFRLKVGSAEVTILKGCHGLEWNSKTGLIYTNIKNDQGAIIGKTLVKHRGLSTATIPLGQATEICVVAIVGEEKVEEKWPLGGPKNVTIEYDYWYY